MLHCVCDACVHMLPDEACPAHYSCRACRWYAATLACAWRHNMCVFVSVADQRHMSSRVGPCGLAAHAVWCWLWRTYVNMNGRLA